MAFDTNREKHNAYNRKWAAEHREKYRKYLYDWHKKRMMWYQGLKVGKKCKICGEDHPACLDFHHRDPKQKDDLIQRLVKRTADNQRIFREISKCDLICANCHRKIHWRLV